MHAGWLAWNRGGRLGVLAARPVVFAVFLAVRADYAASTSMTLGRFFEVWES